MMLMVFVWHVDQPMNVHQHMNRTEDDASLPSSSGHQSVFAKMRWAHETHFWQHMDGLRVPFFAVATQPMIKQTGLGHLVGSFNRPSSLPKDPFAMAPFTTVQKSERPRPMKTLWTLCCVLALSGLGLHMVAFTAGVSSPRVRGGHGGHLTRHQAEGTTLEKPPAGSQWRLNVGRALDVLRRDVSGLFSRKNYTPDFSIYSPDIEVTDARLPSFKIKGLATYQQVLSTLQWSVSTTCHSSKLEITSITPPVNNDMYLRWRLKLWFKDVRSWLGISQAVVTGTEVPFIVEGYSKYTFDPWSAEIATWLAFPYLVFLLFYVFLKHALQNYCLSFQEAPENSSKSLKEIVCRDKKTQTRFLAEICCCLLQGEAHH